LLNGFDACGTGAARAISFHLSLCYGAFLCSVDRKSTSPQTANTLPPLRQAVNRRHLWRLAAQPGGTQSRVALLVASAAEVARTFKPLLQHGRSLSLTTAWGWRWTSNLNFRWFPPRTARSDGRSVAGQPPGVRDLV